MMHKLRYLLVLRALQYSILLYYVFRAQSASQYIINVTAYVLPKNMYRTMYYAIEANRT